MGGDYDGAVPGGSDARAPARRTRISSGIPGLDTVLGGGMFTGSIYLVSGGPGTGKTVLANQLCFAQARTGARCLYVTLLTESHSRMLANLETLDFYDASLVEEHITYLSGGHALREGGTQGLLQMIEEELYRLQPAILILDGFSIGFKMTNTSASEQSVFLNRLAARIEFSGCLAVVGTLSPPTVLAPEHALADGLWELTYQSVGRRAVRELTVSKFRGAAPLGGRHVVEIDARGMVVYPRTEARLAGGKPLPQPSDQRMPFGMKRLDEMLHGGIPCGSTTALIGPTGSGKTLLGLHFLAEGARRGERGLYVGFYESPERVLKQGDSVGLRTSELASRDLLDVLWEPPFENLLDRLVEGVLAQVRQRDIKRLYLDGFDGLLQSALFPERVQPVLSALFHELRGFGVTSMVSVEGELLGKNLVPRAMWSGVVENVLVLRYVEIQSQLRRLLWIVKLRGSDFDDWLHEFRIAEDGIHVEEVFESTRRILSGFGEADDAEGRR